MGSYYNDPSGLGAWYVPAGSTPAQAFDQIVSDTGQTVSPLLSYSVRNTAAAREPLDTKQLPFVTPTTKDVPPGIHNKIISNVPFINCPDGYYFDAFNNQCVPIDTSINPPPGIPTGGSDVGVQAPGYVQVTVNNAVNLASGVGQAIADTVAGGIAEAVDQAKAAAVDAAQAIQAGIQQSIDAVSNATQSLVGGLKDGLEYIGKLIYNNLSSLVSFIVNHIGELVSVVKSTIQDVIIPLAKTVNDAIKEVNNVISNVIAPIFNTISTIYRDTQALIKAIHEDIGAGITGILNLPNDITAAVTSIEGQLQRVFQQIGLKTKDDVSVFTSADGKDSIWSRLDHIGKGVASIGGVDNAKITYADVVRLSEPDLARAGAANVNALVGEITDLVRTLMAGRVGVADAAKAALPLSLPFLGVEFGTWIGIWELFRAIEELFEPFYEFARDEIKAKSGLAKLPVGQVLEAWRRGIVKDEDLKEDLAVNGWDASRIAVLKDLQVYLVDISQSIDMFHRGIIKEDELNNSLRKHGVSGDQMAALKAQSLRLFDPNLAALALKWQLIDEQEFDAVMKRNRFTDEEITVRKVTMFQRETINDVLARERREKLFAGVGYVPEGYSHPSVHALEAALRDGIDATTALDRWQTSFFIPSLQDWIVGHFRNLFTAKELDAAMDFYRVPQQWRDTLVRTHSALIPFRTIPTMLANGIIDEAYAKQQLHAHGFDIIAQEALIKYASLAHKKTVVAASGTALHLSVAVAKGYFDSGTITREQYKEVLLAHGYDEESATLTVANEEAHAAMLARKQLASDIVAEVKSGVMSIEQADNIMDAQQFSPTEKSRVLNNINRMKRSSAKVPSEGELHSMVSHDAITVDQYRSGMVANGWTEPWLSAFITWRFPSATLIASAT